MHLRQFHTHETQTYRRQNHAHIIFVFPSSLKKSHLLTQQLKEIENNIKTNLWFKWK